MLEILEDIPLEIENFDIVLDEENRNKLEKYFKD
jgi:hypothetical protein